MEFEMHKLQDLGFVKKVNSEEELTFVDYELKHGPWKINVVKTIDKDSGRLITQIIEVSIGKETATVEIEKIEAFEIFLKILLNPALPEMIKYKSPSNN